MGDWEQILRELTEIDMRHGGFIQSALDEIESLRQQLVAALAACEEYQGSAETCAAAIRELKSQL